MDCPTCNQLLVREKYEKVPVMRCPDCSGYLVDQKRLVLIKSSREATPEQLKSQVENQSTLDSHELVKCPKCLVNRMEKRKLDKQSEDSYTVDICGDCQVVWFDGGELARMQLDYESSQVAIKQLATQQRVGPLKIEPSDTPGQSMIGQAFSELGLIAVIVAAFSLALIFLLVGWKFVGVLCSLVFTASAVWLGIQRFDESAQKIAVLVIAAIFQIGYLVLTFVW